MTTVYWKCRVRDHSAQQRRGATTHVLICKAGLVFTELWIERLLSFAKNHGMNQNESECAFPEGGQENKMVWATHQPVRLRI